VGIAMDISARRKAEEEKDKMEARLRQAQKLEAVGVLAGGISHDFNNILSAILGFAELARESDPSNRQLQEDLDDINTAANRAKELVQQIQTFSRREVNDPSLLHVPEIIREALKLLRSTLPASIEMAMDIDERVAPILADPEDIHKIITDFCTNAGQSMEDGGLLTVKVSETIPSDDFFSTHPDLARSTYVKIVIQDIGTGIPPKVIDSRFDPYFTTKNYGDGTGLGLAATYGSVRKMDGDISVESEPGWGSIFTVLLPVTAQKVKDDADNAESFAVTSLAGTERIR
jgi:signal transduction histidine kinase